jgi:hypothetical protein
MARWAGVARGAQHFSLAQLLQTPGGLGLLKRLARQNTEAAAQLRDSADFVLQRLPAPGCRARRSPPRSWAMRMRSTTASPQPPSSWPSSDRPVSRATRPPRRMLPMRTPAPSGRAPACLSTSWPGRRSSSMFRWKAEDISQVRPESPPTRHCAGCCAPRPGWRWPAAPSTCAKAATTKVRRAQSHLSTDLSKFRSQHHLCRLARARGSHSTHEESDSAAAVVVKGLIRPREQCMW